MKLDLDDAALFLRVAELGSLSAVARERDMPVSQVSRTLVRLEARCAARLMHRSTHGLSLTDEGDTFAAHARRLVDTTLEAMQAGIAQVKPGATLGDVGHAIQTVAHRENFSVVREYCGHGIGTVYHDEPQVLHYGRRGQGLRLEAGMVFTIEPMLNAGQRETKELADGWTVVTKDRSLSAQWEHMVAVTDSGYEVLTAWPGGTGSYPAI